MKLSKEQIQYIDEYLNRSGVQFWDVRLELLDHFSTGIEEKMTNENKSKTEKPLTDVTKIRSALMMLLISLLV